MSNSIRKFGSLAALLLLMVLPAVFGYSFNGKRWSGGTATFFTGMSGTSPSGTKWSTAFEAAMQEWTQKTPFVFVSDKNYVDPCLGYKRNTTGSGFPSGDGDLHNSADFHATVCGNDFGSTVLAITLTTTNPGQFGFDYLKEADIIFNEAFNWDVYTGPRKSTVVNGKSTSITDFSRVAIHELGHALGLDHESVALSIMAPKITDMYQLQTDDISGATALYGTQTLCKFSELSFNSVIRDALEQKDCRVKELFGSSSDDSFVDVYTLKLDTVRRVVIDIRSKVLDPVIVLTDNKLQALNIEEDFQGTCVAHLDKILQPGEYKILANTYAKPKTYNPPKSCSSNTGAYSMSISDGAQPVLGETSALGGGDAAASLFSGGATADGGKTFKATFAANEAIDVMASITVDPSHVGESSRIFVLVQASNGLRYSKTASGSFVPFNGDLSTLQAVKSGVLSAQEQLAVVSGLRGEGTALAGLGFAVYIGYALDKAPQNIHYGADPIRFSISR